MHPSFPLEEELENVPSGHGLYDLALEFTLYGSFPNPVAKRAALKDPSVYKVTSGTVIACASESGFLKKRISHFITKEFSKMKLAVLAFNSI